MVEEQDFVKGGKDDFGSDFQEATIADPAYAKKRKSDEDSSVDDQDCSSYVSNPFVVNSVSIKSENLKREVVKIGTRASNWKSDQNPRAKLLGKNSAIVENWVTQTNAGPATTGPKKAAKRVKRN